LGLVASLNRPGANLTGSAILTAELAPKQLQLLRELVPNAAQFGVLSDPAFPGIHPTTRTGPDVASLRNEGSLFMRHVLIAFMLVMSISSDGFANETQLHWTYLKYDGSTASATLKIDTVRRPQRFTLVLSDFNKSVEVYSVAYSVVSRLRIPEEFGIAALADPTAKLKGVVLSGRPKDIQEARETMLLVNQTALTKYSRDELCPPRTDHVLFLGIRDVMAMPFCLVKKEPR
jgi:hypothetical protein